MILLHLNFLAIAKKFRWTKKVPSSIDSKIKNYLDRLADAENRPNSYIFAGFNEESKESAVFYIVSRIAGKFGDQNFLERAKTKNHPDVLIIEPEIEEKKGRTREKEIGIAQVRDALERLKFFPYELEKKFCIIRKAQKMNLEAANALLKSLEEPSERAIFILLANDAESVLPTIVSRCAVFRFPMTKLPSWNEENRGTMRAIFRKDIFERFDFVEKNSKNRNEMIAVLKDWEMVMAESLRTLIKNNEDGRKIDKVVELIENTRQSVNRLEHSNASTRSVGEELVLSF